MWWRERRSKSHFGTIKEENVRCVFCGSVGLDDSMQAASHWSHFHQNESLSIRGADNGCSCFLQRVLQSLEVLLRYRCTCQDIFVGYETEVFRSFVFWDDIQGLALVTLPLPCYHMNRYGHWGPKSLPCTFRHKHQGLGGNKCTSFKVRIMDILLLMSSFPKCWFLFTETHLYLIYCIYRETYV